MTDNGEGIIALSHTQSLSVYSLLEWNMCKLNTDDGLDWHMFYTNTVMVRSLNLPQSNPTAAGYCMIIYTS